MEKEHILDEIRRTAVDGRPLGRDQFCIEKYWHGRFSMKRLNGINKQSGEWFDLSKEDISAFKKRKFM